MLPIKIVTEHNPQTNKVIIDTALRIVVIAILTNANKSTKIVWQVLLDSGSNRDLLFVKKVISYHVALHQQETHGDR